MNIKDVIKENIESDSDLFGSASVRDKLHKQINSLYDKIGKEYDDLGFEALMSTKVYSKLFDKWDDGEHDPNEVMAYKEPVNLLVQAVAEMEDVSQNAYDYLELEENKESDSDLFGGGAARPLLLSKYFEFPEGGNLGYTEGGGGIGYGGQRTNGLVIVNRASNQIAFVPDFTYFDEEPTQETLEEWWYEHDAEYALDKLPLTLQNVEKFLELNESESDSDLFGDPGAVSINAVRALRNQNKTNKDPFNNTRQYGDHRIKSNGKIYRQDQEARRHRVGARLGRHANPVLPESESDDDLFGHDMMLDKIHDAYARIYNYDNNGLEMLDALAGTYNELSEKYNSANIDSIIAQADAIERKQLLLDLEYVADACDEQYGHMGIYEAEDDDLFSTARRAPPKDLNLLLGWAGNDPEKEDFAYVAKFGIKHNMNLKQTFEVLQHFDDVPGNSRLEKKWGVSEAMAMRLFIAYEYTYDAWEPAGNNGEQAAHDFWEAADAELAEPPEPPRRAAAPTKDKPKLDPNMFAPQMDQPLAKTDPLDDLKKNAGIGGDRPTVDLRKSSQANTLNKTAGLGSADMSNMLGRMRNIEIDKDLDAYPDQDSETVPSVEVNTANLPAVAGQALRAAGVENPEFHQVANLPGNMADQIRQLGKSLFGSMTMTPTKRIHVIANLGGKGPNSTQEVNAVAGFLKQHGSDRGPGDVDFDAVMPGYKAQTHMYTAAGIRWMLVKDFAGQYIYCWPEEDSHDAAPALGNDSPEAPRLR